MDIDGAIEQGGGINGENVDVLWNALNLGEMLQKDKVIPPSLKVNKIPSVDVSLYYN